MASLADIRAGLKTNLVAAFPTTDVHLYTLGNASPPCFEIDLAADGVDFDLAMNGGLHWIPMVVRILVSDTSDVASQITVDTYMDGAASTDVKRALEADKSLGGAAQAIQVTGVVPRRWKSETTGGQLVGLEWNVSVLSTGVS